MDDVRSTAMVHLQGLARRAAECVGQAIDQGDAWVALKVVEKLYILPSTPIVFQPRVETMPSIESMDEAMAQLNEVLQQLDLDESLHSEEWQPKGRYRRLIKDYEHHPLSSETQIYLAMIHRMARLPLSAPDSSNRWNVRAHRKP